MVAILRRLGLCITVGIISLALSACHPITKPLDPSLLKYQPSGIAKPLESYRLRYRSEQIAGEEILFEFAWTRTKGTNGFDLASYGLVTARGSVMSSIEYLIGDMSYEWMAGDPNLGIWSIHERSMYHPNAIFPGAPFDFADPAILWNLSVKEIATPENLVGIEDINGLKTHHYYSAPANTDLWLAVEGGFVIKYVVNADKLKTHALRSFALYDINQPLVLQPPAHAQWLVDALTQSSIHFPGCEPCIFPIPQEIVHIGRSPMTNGRDLWLTTQWPVPEIKKFLEEKLPQHNWKILSQRVEGTTQIIVVSDGAHEFNLSMLPDESNVDRPPLTILTIMPVDLTGFPIVLDEK